MGKGLDVLLAHLKGLEGNQPHRNETDSPNGSGTPTDRQPAEHFSDTHQNGTDRTDKTSPLGTQAPRGAIGTNLKTTYGYEELTDRQAPEVLAADPEGERSETPAERLGLTAYWPARKQAHLKGFLEIHDPTTGKRYHIRKEAPPAWAKAEASKRAQMYRSGVANAYLLTSGEMEEIWRQGRTSDPFEREHYLPITEKGIVYEVYLGSAE